MHAHHHVHKHTNFFAPILICLVFGFAIIAMFPMVFDSDKMSYAMSYDDCASQQGSRIQESYPPVCVTKEGKSFTKDLPKVKMPAVSNSAPAN